MHAPILAVLAATALLATASPSSSHYASGTPSTCKHASTDAHYYYKAEHSPLAKPYYEHVKPYKGDRDASILQILRKDRRFSKLVAALSRAGGSLRDDLDDPNSKEKITLLSPTDEAFEVLEKMHGQTVETMDQQTLERILAYHVIPEQDSNEEGAYFYGHKKHGKYSKFTGPQRGIRKEDLCDGETLETALVEKRLGDHQDVGNRQRIRVTKYSGKVILNMYSMVIDSDMEASNGVIHAVADVLITPEQLFQGTASLPSMFSTQALALQLTGLDKRVNEERGVTAFVPTNAAWEALGFFESMELFHPSKRDQLKKFLERHYISEPLYVNELIDEEELKGTRAGATCAAAKRGDHAYFEQLRREHYFAKGEHESKKVGKFFGKGKYYGKAYYKGGDHHRGGDDSDVIEKEYETWAGDKLTLRVECHENGVDVLVDNALISLSDIPAANGVLQVISQPIDASTYSHEGDDDNEGEGERDDEPSFYYKGSKFAGKHHGGEHYYKGGKSGSFKGGKYYYGKPASGYSYSKGYGYFPKEFAHSGFAPSFYGGFGKFAGGAAHKGSFYFPGQF